MCQNPETHTQPSNPEQADKEFMTPKEREILGIYEDPRALDLIKQVIPQETLSKLFPSGLEHVYRSRNDGRAVWAVGSDGKYYLFKGVGLFPDFTKVIHGDESQFRMQSQLGFAQAPHMLERELDTVNNLTKDGFTTRKFIQAFQFPPNLSIIVDGQEMTTVDAKQQLGYLPQIEIWEMQSPLRIRDLIHPPKNCKREFYEIYMKLIAQYARSPDAPPFMQDSPNLYESYLQVNKNIIQKITAFVTFWGSYIDGLASFLEEQIGILTDLGYSQIENSFFHDQNITIYAEIVDLDALIQAPDQENNFFTLKEMIILAIEEAIIIRVATNPQIFN